MNEKFCYIMDGQEAKWIKLVVSFLEEGYPRTSILEPNIDIIVMLFCVCTDLTLFCVCTDLTLEICSYRETTVND